MLIFLFYCQTLVPSFLEYLDPKSFHFTRVFLFVGFFTVVSLPPPPAFFEHVCLHWVVSVSFSLHCLYFLLCAPLSRLSTWVVCLSLFHYLPSPPPTLCGYVYTDPPPPISLWVCLSILTPPPPSLCGYVCLY